MKKESIFQRDLIEELKRKLPGCIITKNDSGYIQGIPDLLILFGEKWAALECKKNEAARHQPNQDYYIGKMEKMSFASFIYPEIKDIVIEKLMKFFLS